MTDRGACGALRRMLDASGLRVDGDQSLDWSVTPQVKFDVSVTRVPAWMDAPDAENVAFYMSVDGDRRRVSPKAAGPSGWYRLDTPAAAPLRVSAGPGRDVSVTLSAQLQGRDEEDTILEGTFAVPESAGAMGAPATTLVTSGDVSAIVFLDLAVVDGERRYVSAGANVKLE